MPVRQFRQLIGERASSNLPAQKRSYCSAITKQNPDPISLFENAANETIVFGGDYFLTICLDKRG